MYGAWLPNLTLSNTEANEIRIYILGYASDAQLRQIDAFVDNYSNKALPDDFLLAENGDPVNNVLYRTVINNGKVRYIYNNIKDTTFFINPRYRYLFRRISHRLILRIKWDITGFGPYTAARRVVIGTPQKLGGVNSRLRATSNMATYDLQYTQAGVDLPLTPAERINHTLVAINNNNNNNNFPQQTQIHSEIITATDQAELLEVFAPTTYPLWNNRVVNQNLNRGIYYIAPNQDAQEIIHQLPEIESGVPESDSIANLIRNSERVELNTTHRNPRYPSQNYDLITLDHNIIVVMHDENAPTPAIIQNNYTPARRRQQWFNDGGRSFRVFRSQIRLKSNNDGLIDVTRTVYNPPPFNTDNVLTQDANGNAYCIGDSSTPCNSNNNAREIELPNVNQRAPFVEDEYIGQDNTYYFLEQNNVIEAMSPTGIFSQAAVEDLMPGEVLVGFAHRYIDNDEIYLQSSLKRYFSLSYSSLAGTDSEVVATPVTPLNTRELVSDTNATYYDDLDPHDHEYHYEVFGYANKDGIPDTPDGYISPSNAHFLFKSSI
jgi:hypothetical protein